MLKNLFGKIKSKSYIVLTIVLAVLVATMFVACTTIDGTNGNGDGDAMDVVDTDRYANFNSASTWKAAVTQASSESSFAVAALSSNWTAAAGSNNHYDFGTDEAAFENGALLIPEGKYVEIRLGTYTLNRNLANTNGVEGGAVIINRGTLRITATVGKGTITGGFNTGTTGDLGLGGAIVNYGTLTMTNVTVQGNKSGYYGGAIYGFAGSVTTLNTCTFQNNGYTTTSSGTTVFTIRGGAIWTKGQLEITGGTYKNNKARDHGGAIAMEGNDTITITNATISNNQTMNYDGGAMHIGVGTGAMTLTGCTISGNIAARHGGGFYMAHPGTITDCQITDNLANNVASTVGIGGGIYFGPGAGKTITIKGTSATNKTVISGNGAASGGGIYLYSGNLVIEDYVAITQNKAGCVNTSTATYGAGICVKHPANLTVGKPTGTGSEYPMITNNSPYDGTVMSVRGGGVGLLGASGTQSSKSVFNFYEGCINNNIDRGSGAGIYTGANVQVHMYNNAQVCNNEHSVVGNSSLCGVDIYSAGIMIYGELYMHGGLISGNGKNNAGPGYYGGGICAYGICDILGETQCTITDNKAHSGGGGICTRSSTSLVTIGTIGGDNDKIMITDNVSNNYIGGVFTMSGLTVINSGTIKGNKALYVGGVGSHSNGSGVLEIHGGIYTENAATHVNTNGGAIDMGRAAGCLIENAKIYNNTSAGKGGGIVARYSDLTIKNNEIYNNTAVWGGGIYVDWQTGIGNETTSVTMENNKIYNNIATHNGTAAYNAGGVYIANNCSVAMNGDQIYNNYVKPASATNGGKVTDSGGVFAIGAISMAGKMNITGNKQYASETDTTGVLKNLNLTSGVNVVITAALAYPSGTSPVIGVYSLGQITQDFTDYHAASVTATKYFVSDRDSTYKLDKAGGEVFHVLASVTLPTTAVAPPSMVSGVMYTADFSNGEAVPIEQTIINGFDSTKMKLSKLVYTPYTADLTKETLDTAETYTSGFNKRISQVGTTYTAALAGQYVLTFAPLDSNSKFLTANATTGAIEEAATLDLTVTIAKRQISFTQSAVRIYGTRTVANSFSVWFYMCTKGEVCNFTSKYYKDKSCTQEVAATDPATAQTWYSLNTPEFLNFSYNDLTSVSDARNTFVSNSPYKGSVTVAKAGMTSVSVTVADANNIRYDGTAKTPAITVTDPYNTKPVLVEGTDYTLSYANNIQVGLATVTITATSTCTNFTGSKEVTFKIQNPPATAVISGNFSLSGDNALSKVYDGTTNYTGVATNTFVSSDPNLTITNVTYEYSASKVGTGYKIIATLYFSGTSAPNYGLTTYTISGASIVAKSIDTCTVANLSNIVYDGEKHDVEPTITAALASGNSTLVKDTDYTVTYSSSNTADTTNTTQVGLITLTITGKGNYTGQVEKTFSITSAALTVSVATNTFDYDGKTHVAINASSSIADGKIKIPITVKSVGSGNTTTIKLVKASSQPSDWSTVTANSLNFVNVADGGTIQYQVTVTNHTVKTGNFKVTINRQKINIPTVVEADLTYTGAAQNMLVGFNSTTMAYSKVNFTQNGGTTVTSLSSKTTKYTDAGTYEWQITPTANYQWKNNGTGGTATGVTKGVTKTIAPKTLTGTTWVSSASGTSTTFTYSGARQGFSASFTTSNGAVSADIAKLGGKVTYTGVCADNSTYNNTLLPFLACGTYTATLTALTGDRAFNYALPTATQTKTFKINPLTIGVTWGAKTFVYDGAAHCPTATVSNLKTAATGNTDTCLITVQTLDSSNKEISIINTNDFSGTTSYTATMTALTGANAANYALPSTKTTTFTITRVGITLEISPISEVYTGVEATVNNEQGVRWSLKNDGVSTIYKQGSTKDDLGVTLTKATGVNVGSYDITGVVANKNYNATFEGGTNAFTITARALSNGCSINTISAQTYKGSEIQPVPVVKYSTVTLVQNTDFTIKEYKNNVNVGTATVTVEGKGNYSGTISKNFSIKAKALTSILWTGTADFTYTYMGDETGPIGQGPTASVGTAQGVVSSDVSKIGLTVMYSSDKYTASANKPSDAYTYTATVTAITGSVASNYSLPSALTQAFTINPKQAAISWTNLTFVYDGTAHIPTPAVSNLVKGDEGKVTVDSVGSRIHFGNFTATATELAGERASNYALVAASEGKTQAYSVTAAPITLLVNSQTATYIGAEPFVNSIKDTDWSVFSGDLYVPADGNGERDALNVVLNKEAGINCGSYNFTATFDNPDYNVTFIYDPSGTSAIVNKFVIEPRDLTDTTNNCTVVVDDIIGVVYNGVAQTPTPVVKFVTLIDTTLVEETDYVKVVAADYANNTLAGVDTASVTITGMGNFKGTLVKKFTIERAPLTLSVPNVTNLSGKSYAGYVGQTLADITIDQASGSAANKLAATSDLESVAGTFVWKNTAEVIVNKDAKTKMGVAVEVGHIATFVPTDTNNYIITDGANDVEITFSAYQLQVTVIEYRRDNSNKVVTNPPRFSYSVSYDGTFTYNMHTAASLAGYNSKLVVTESGIDRDVDSAHPVTNITTDTVLKVQYTAKSDTVYYVFHILQYLGENDASPDNENTNYTTVETIMSVFQANHLYLPGFTYDITDCSLPTGTAIDTINTALNAYHVVFERYDDGIAGNVVQIVPLTSRSVTSFGFDEGSEHPYTGFVYRKVTDDSKTINADGSTIIYPRYYRARNIVRWNANSDNGLLPSGISQNTKYAYGSRISDIDYFVDNPPTRVGYIFENWATTPSGKDGSGNSTIFSFATNRMPETGVTFYAQWDAVDYTVFLVGDYIKGVQGSKFPIEEFENMPVSSSNYLFTMATDFTSGVSLNGTAYQFPYDASTGRIVLPTPTKEGFDFAGWYYRRANSAEDVYTVVDQLTATWLAQALIEANNEIYVYAKWTAASYQVTLDGNGVSLSSSVAKFWQPNFVPYIAAKLYEPTRKGYVFSGWYTDLTDSYSKIITSAPVEQGDPELTYANLKGAITLYAKWTPIGHIVQIQDLVDGGEGSSGSVVTIYRNGEEVNMNGSELQPNPNSGYSGDRTFKINDKLRISIAIATGYTLKSIKVTTKINGTATTKSLSNNGTFNVAGVYDDFAINVVITYKPVAYRISYISNGGNWVDGYSAPASYNVLDSTQLPGKDDIARTGYNFIAWFSQADADYNNDYAIVTLGGSSDEVGNKTVYAIWEAKAQKVQIYHNNAKFSQNYRKDVWAKGNENDLDGVKYLFREYGSVYSVNNIACYDEYEGESYKVADIVTGMHIIIEDIPLPTGLYLLGFATTPSGPVVYPVENLHGNGKTVTVQNDANENVVYTTTTIEFTVQATDEGNCLYAKWANAKDQLVVITANNADPVYTASGDAVTLTAKAELTYGSITDPSFTFQWYKAKRNAAGDDFIYTYKNRTTGAEATYEQYVADYEAKGLNGDIIRLVAPDVSVGSPIASSEAKPSASLNRKNVADSGYYICTMSYTFKIVNSANAEETITGTAVYEPIYVKIRPATFDGVTFADKVGDNALEYTGDAQDSNMRIKNGTNVVSGSSFTLSDGNAVTVTYYSYYAAADSADNVTIAAAVANGSYVNVGYWEITAVFGMPANSNYEPIPNYSATLQIKPKTITALTFSSNIAPEDLVTIEDKPNALARNYKADTDVIIYATSNQLVDSDKNNLDKIKIVLAGDSARDVGSYYAEFSSLEGSSAGNYIVNFSTEGGDSVKRQYYEILLANYVMNGVLTAPGEWETSWSGTYDGNAHVAKLVFPDGESLPDGVTIAYSLNFVAHNFGYQAGGSALTTNDKDIGAGGVAAGIYKVIVSFYGNDNYNPIPDQEVEFDIARANFIVDYTEDCSDNYDFTDNQSKGYIAPPVNAGDPDTRIFYLPKVFSLENDTARANLLITYFYEHIDYIKPVAPETEGTVTNAYPVDDDEKVNGFWQGGFYRATARFEFVSSEYINNYEALEDHSIIFEISKQKVESIYISAANNSTELDSAGGIYYFSSDFYSAWLDENKEPAFYFAQEPDFSKMLSIWVVYEGGAKERISVSDCSIWDNTVNKEFVLFTKAPYDSSLGKYVEYSVKFTAYDKSATLNVIVSPVAYDTSKLQAESAKFDTTEKAYIINYSEVYENGGYMPAIEGIIPDANGDPTTNIKMAFRYKTEDNKDADWDTINNWGIDLKLMNAGTYYVQVGIHHNNTDYLGACFYEDHTGHEDDVVYTAVNITFKVIIKPYVISNITLRSSTDDTATWEAVTSEGEGSAKEYKVTYAAKKYSFEASYKGLDNLTYYALGVCSSDIENVATYTMALSSENGNYVISDTAKTIKISVAKANVDVVWYVKVGGSFAPYNVEIRQLVYTGSDLFADISAEYTNLKGESVAINKDTKEVINAGNHTITAIARAGTDDDNYEIGNLTQIIKVYGAEISEAVLVDFDDVVDGEYVAVYSGTLYYKGGEYNLRAKYTVGGIDYYAPVSAIVEGDSNNTIVTPRNADNYILTVGDHENYYITRVFTLSIKQYAVTAVRDTTSLVYDATTKTLVISAKGVGDESAIELLVLSGNTAINVNGEDDYVAVAKLASAYEKNYFLDGCDLNGEKQYRWNIKPAVAEFAWTASSLVTKYNGTAQFPQVIVNNAQDHNAYSIVMTLAGGNATAGLAINVGEYVVSITQLNNNDGTRCYNYTVDGSQSSTNTFKINPGDLSIASVYYNVPVYGNNITYSDTLFRNKFIYGVVKNAKNVDVNGTYSFIDERSAEVSTETQIDYYVSFVPDASYNGNYNSCNTSIKLTVKPLYLVGIVVDKELSKLDYQNGQPFRANNIFAKAIYNNYYVDEDDGIEYGKFTSNIQPDKMTFKYRLKLPEGEENTSAYTDLFSGTTLRVNGDELLTTYELIITSTENIVPGTSQFISGATELSVTGKPIKSIEAIEGTGKREYYVGECFTLFQLRIKITFNDDTYETLGTNIVFNKPADATRPLVKGDSYIELKYEYSSIVFNCDITVLDKIDFTVSYDDVTLVYTGAQQAIPLATSPISTEEGNVLKRGQTYDGVTVKYDLTQNGVAVALREIGEYTITLTLTATEDALIKYNIPRDTIQIKVTIEDKPKVQISVNIDSSWTYGDTSNHAPVVTTNPADAKAIAVVTYGKKGGAWNMAQLPTSAGEYMVHVVIAEFDSSDGNSYGYSVSEPVYFKIEKAPLTVTIPAVTIETRVDYTPDITINGFVNGEDADMVGAEVEIVTIKLTNGTKTFSKYTSLDGEVYTVIAQLKNSLDNYDVTYWDIGTLTISEVKGVELLEQSNYSFGVVEQGVFVDKERNEISGSTPIYLRGVAEKQTIEDIKKHFKSNSYTFETQNVTSKNGYLGTGSKIIVKNVGTIVDEITVIVKGDATGDGQVNNQDKLQIQRYIAGTFELNELQKLAFDTNGDGKINNADKLQIQRYIAGTYDLFLRVDLD